MSATGKHGCMAATILMGLNARYWQGACPKVWSILECMRFDRREYVIGNADIGRMKYTAMRPSRL
jgi:hypothetical protein